MNDFKLADSSEKPVDPTAFYELAIKRSQEAASAGDTHAAFSWLRQAEFIGTTVLKKTELPEVNTGLVLLIVRNCQKARDLAIHSGNVTRDHFKWAFDLKTMATQLKSRLSGGDPALLARATVIEGIALQVFQQLSRFRRTEQYYTPKAVLDPFIDNLTTILANAALLGVDVNDPYGDGDGLLELARTATSNAQFTINYFNWLSDWDKAQFYCERALQSLSQVASAEGSATEPELEQVQIQLKTAEQAIQSRNYRHSVTALKDAHEKITAFIANQ